MNEDQSHRSPAQTYEGVPVLVTGATGFIGRWVGRELSRRRADLKLVTRDPSRLSSICRTYRIAGEPVAADLREPGAVRKVIERHRPAIVFNMAGYGVQPAEREERLLRAMNEELPERIARVLADLEPPRSWPGLRLVHAGTAFEYGPLPGPIAEGHEPAPTTDYGSSKLEGTRRVSRLCADHDLPACTARLATVYGPGEQAHRLLPSLLRAASSGQPVALTGGDQRRDFTYVADAAQGLLLLGLAGAAPGGVVNLATGSQSSVRSFVESAIEVLGMEGGQARFGTLPQRGNEVRQGPLEIGLLRELVGWQPETTVPDGIRQTREFHRAAEVTTSEA